MRYVVITVFALIVGSLASAGYYIIKDKGRGDRAVKALTLRVVFSLALFILLMLAVKFGFITHKL